MTASAKSTDCCIIAENRDEFRSTCNYWPFKVYWCIDFIILVKCIQLRAHVLLRIVLGILRATHWFLLHIGLSQMRSLISAIWYKIVNNNTIWTVGCRKNGWPNLFRFGLMCACHLGPQNFLFLLTQLKFRWPILLNATRYSSANKRHQPRTGSNEVAIGPFRR